MTYFSRLTDIVTCNLTELLKQADDPQAAVAQIISEMEEGLAGAKRSVTTALNNESRLSNEIAEQQQQSQQWSEKAKQSVLSRNEVDARQCLLRKRELEDLIAGLRQQHQAAVATREHLSTMQRALEARHAEALRKQAAMVAGSTAEPSASVSTTGSSTLPEDRLTQIDDELAALRKELGM
ncbi:hypothetical protein GC163_14820 [bacterium]|nr:hypothetical protein [bacterium]